jgi:hypothetical protein
MPIIKVRRPEPSSDDEGEEESSSFDFSSSGEEEVEEVEVKEKKKEKEKVKSGPVSSLGSYHFKLDQRGLLLGNMGSGKSNTIRYIISQMVKRDGDKISSIYWVGASSWTEEKWLPKSHLWDKLSEKRMQKIVEIQKHKTMADKYIIIVLDDVAALKLHGNRVFSEFYSAHSRKLRICILFGVQLLTQVPPVVRSCLDWTIITASNNKIVSELHQLSMMDYYPFRKLFQGIIPKKRPLFIHKGESLEGLYDVPLCTNPLLAE